MVGETDAGTTHDDVRAGAETPSPIQEETATTRHSVRVGEVEVRYTATAGTLLLREEVGTPKASIFYVAYTRDWDGDRSERPLTFAFNGGPGSSSVWLHLGLLGPRRVRMGDAPTPPPPPYRLVENAHTLLDATDLVFIDPVTTGYSREAPDEEQGAFHGFEQDIASVGDFIRLYTTRARRWASPKFVIGESYGTTRAAGLSGYLQKRHGLYLNGVMLISTVLNFLGYRFDPGNDLPYLLFLPTYAATAWYHHRLPEAVQQRDLRDLLDEVEAFALGDYALALLQGASLPAATREDVIARLARYTGLSPRYLAQTNMRIEIHRFAKELLRDQRRTVGRLDSRFTGMERDAAGEKLAFDPSYAAIQGPYTALLNHYVRNALAFKSDLPYEVLTDRVHPWDYGKHQNQYVNVAATLRQAMCQNPHLKVFVANGYYDLATPYLATAYTFDHMDLEPELRDNISMAHYASGHMMYIHEPSLAQLKEDLAAFLHAAVPAVS
jgi:carboxypeptidase C (cathepsin A)